MLGSKQAAHPRGVGHQTLDDRDVAGKGEALLHWAGQVRRRRGAARLSDRVEGNMGHPERQSGPSRRPEGQLAAQIPAQHRTSAHEIRIREEMRPCGGAETIKRQYTM